MRNLHLIQRCNYPNWVLKRLKNNYKYNNINSNKNVDNIYMVVFYTKGLSESLKNICSIMEYQYTSMGIITSKKSGDI